MKNKKNIKLIQGLLVSIIAFMYQLPSAFAISEGDFAYTANLSIEEGKPYYELEIPETVYKSVSRTDLGDIRVFNGAGQLVPHGLRNLASEKTSSTHTESVPYFPIYQKEGESKGSLHLNIQRSANGEVIDIKSSAAVKSSTDHLTGYLIDLREWQQAVEQIKFSWKVSKDVSFIRKLKIFSSENLSDWAVISTDKALVNLSYQNYQLIEDNIPLALNSGRYLKIIFSDNKPGLQLDNIEVVNTQSSFLQKQNWQQVSVSKGEDAGEYIFQYQLKTLLRKLRVQLPENNTVVEAKVMSRADENSDWQYRGSAVLYRLSVDGVSIQNSEISVIASTDSEWKLKIDQQGGGIGTNLPEIEFAWKPQQLVFVARGEPPYKLAWGSARVEPVTQNASNILVGVNQDNRASMIDSAQWLTDSVRAVNLQSLEAVTKPINWRQWLLWLVLIFAAMVLVWMALRLMGKMAE